MNSPDSVACALRELNRAVRTISESPTVYEGLYQVAVGKLEWLASIPDLPDRVRFKLRQLDAQLTRASGANRAARARGAISQLGEAAAIQISEDLARLSADIALELFEIDNRHVES